MKDFLGRFGFCENKAFLVGIERECFLTRGGEISPIAPKVLSILGISERFGYELSACQLEDRIGPCRIEDAMSELMKNEEDIKKAEREIDFGRLFTEVASKGMSLDVYPDPTGRYQKIIQGMPEHILSAACRVTGTHIHIGMPDHKTALRVYNQVIKSLDGLCELGDGSAGERLGLYKMMAPKFQSPHYESWETFYKEAIREGFVLDPRKCWNLIRISTHGTIEFRMFGSTSDLEKIVSWASICHQLCQNALKT